MRRLVAALLAAVLWPVVITGTADAAGFVPVAGSGSASNVLDQWRRDIANTEGITVNYSANGSFSGRKDFGAGQVDFAISGIPYGLIDGGVLDPRPSRAFGYVPIIASGVAFMYNLKIGNKRVTNLQLSGDTLTKIFTQKITNWSDPAIKADNPGLALPARTIVPVVRSDGADTTAQFTAWMASQYPAVWDDYCHLAGRNLTPCGFTSFYPPHNMNSKSGSQGVAGFVAQDSSVGTITYVEYSYARNSGFPVVKVLNKANYYVEPTANNVAIALLKAQLQPDHTADLSQVYVDPDPRAYPLSGYSYLIVPEDTSNNFNTEKGRTLSEFAYYALCQGQQEADAPLPINLARPALDEAGLIPGSTHKVTSTNLQNCSNPTFSPDGTDLLVTNAPQPESCDFNGPTQCTDGTGSPTPSPTPEPSPTPPAVTPTPTVTSTPPSPTPEPTLAVPLPTPPAGLTGPALAFWQQLVTWLLGQLQELGF